MSRCYNKEVEDQMGEDSYLCGIYSITCTANGKFYIGSTNQTFNKRLAHHISLLRSGKHKNIHLQRCWDKYGEDSFKYRALEICDPADTLSVEQEFLSTSWGNPLLLNINPLASGTPNMSKETIAKRAETMRRKYRSGEIEPVFKKGRTPWNKGLTSNDHDYSHLRVPKTITEELKNAHKRTSDRSRARSPVVEVYDSLYNLLGTWESSKDLEEWSKTEENDLPISGRFTVPRSGVPLSYLNSGNILKAAKTGKSYKGLYFKLQIKNGE